jgi:hypothetical protein
MKRSPLRIAAAACMLAVGIGFFIFVSSRNNAGQRDFISYWAAGKQLIHGANPYDAAAIMSLERTAGYDLDYRLIMRNPPWALFLALPLGFVNPNAGLVLWLIALLASLVASVRMIWALHGRPDNRLHLLGYCFAPVMVCLMAGQFGIFMLLGVVLFLYFHLRRPFLAGSALLLCVVKPHLFLLFGVVLLLWAISRKAYRILVGFAVALFASYALTFCFDSHAWSQYSQMISTSGIMNEIVPTLSELFRQLVHREAVWLQFLPEAFGCAWALWYFWTRQSRWSWTNQGLLLLIVSVLCSPYALFPDEAILLPAVLTGVYRADNSGRSLVPFGLFASIAIVEVFAKVSMTTFFYLWTVPAWLAWYLYATRAKTTHAEIADAVEGNITPQNPN